MTIQTVSSLDGITSDEISLPEAGVVAEHLADGTRAVVWLPEWLVEKKPLTTIDGWYRLVEVIDIDDYSEDSLRVRQHGEPSVYLPKSKVTAFTLADGSYMETLSDNQ